jgi:hypothetical protein
MPKLLAILCAVVLLASCGSLNGDYCDAERKCEGGNDKDEAACIAERDGDSAAAEAYGCLEQHDRWMKCVVNKATCEPVGHDGADVLTTRDPVTDVERCEDQEQKLSSCIHGASGR